MNLLDIKEVLLEVKFERRRQMPWEYKKFDSIMPALLFNAIDAHTSLLDNRKFVYETFVRVQRKQFFIRVDTDG